MSAQPINRPKLKPNRPKPFVQIAMDTQSSPSPNLSSRSNCQAQSDLGLPHQSKPNPIWAPDISKVQSLFATAISKLQIHSWALHLYQKGSAVFTRTWLSRPPALGDSVYFHRHISNISQTLLFIYFIYLFNYLIIYLFIHLFIYFIFN